LNQTASPLLSIIILNYNAGELLLKCIESVFNSSYENYEVIVVDNGSEDESHKKCKQKFSKVILIENQKNLGFCEGNNVGIRNAKGDFLIILNPDTEVKSNAFEELYKAFCRYGDGLYQPKLLVADDKKKINTAGNMINLFGFGYSRGKGKEDRGQFFRDLIYISNVVSGINAIIQKGKPGNLYWISSGKKTWFYEIGNLLEELTGTKVKYIEAPEYTKKVDVGNFLVDNSKLMSLGWKPETTIKDGIKQTLDYFKSTLY